MSGVSTCLRRTFTVFNVFFAIVGALMVGMAFTHQVLTSVHGGENVRNGIYALYIVGTVTMVTASLGAYGAHKESKLCLSLFLGCMVTGTLLMLMYGIPAAISRHQVEDMIENDMHSFVPLSKAPEEIKSMIDTIQTEVHCCGLFSYTDWENNIPESCKCSPMEEDKCQAANLLFLQRNVSVYSKTCLPFIMDSFRLVVNILIGTLFTLAGLAMLGTILSSIMIHQMLHPTAPAVVLKMPHVLIPAPPKYEKLQEDPPAYY